MKKTSVSVLLLVAAGSIVLFYEKDTYNQYVTQDKPAGGKNIPSGEYATLLSGDEFIEKIGDYYDIEADEPEQSEKQTGMSNNLSVRRFLDEANASIREGWNNRDFSGIDLLTQRFVFSPDISRADKIRALWSIAGNTRTDFQYRFFIDNLATLSPVELADDIINAYYSTDSVNRKIGLLRLMETFPDAGNPSVQTELQLQYIGEQMVKVRSVLEKEIQANNNELIFEEVIEMYDRFSPEPAVTALLKELFDREDLVIGKQEKLDTMIALSFGTHQRQRTFMPQLLTAISNFEQQGSGSTDEDNDLSPSDRYIALLSDFNREWMDKDVVPSIREFLKNNKPSEPEIVDDPAKYEDWVISSLRYGDNPPENEAAAMTDFIFNLDDPVRAAALVSTADEEVLLKLIHDERLPSFLDGLQLALQEPNTLSASRREFIQEEVDRLSRIPIPGK